LSNTFISGGGTTGIAYGVLKRGESMLTPKQEEFAKKIAEGMTQADAYRSAYSTKRMTDKTIWENASRLMADSKVVARVKELRDMIAKPTIITAQKRKEWLTEVINDPNMDINAKLKASDQLNRMEGEYIQKVETEIKNAVNINIELSDD
jgi:hypothetical protein